MLTAGSCSAAISSSVRSFWSGSSSAGDEPRHRNQIKNGTIGAKDLSKSVRAQIKKAKVPGPRGLQGLKGDVGPAGPLTTTLPVGQTLRGRSTSTAPGRSPGASAGGAVSFGLRLRSAPTTVIRSPAAPPDVAMPRERRKPQAASGVACFYLLGTMSHPTSRTSRRAPGAQLPDSNTGANVFGAELFIFSTAIGPVLRRRHLGGHGN